MEISKRLEQKETEEKKAAAEAEILAEKSTTTSKEGGNCAVESNKNAITEVLVIDALKTQKGIIKLRQSLNPI